MLEIHFFHFAELNPAESYAGCYMRVSHVDDLSRNLMLTPCPCSVGMLTAREQALGHAGILHRRSEWQSD